LVKLQFTLKNGRLWSYFIKPVTIVPRKIQYT